MSVDQILFKNFDITDTDNITLTGDVGWLDIAIRLLLLTTYDLPRAFSQYNGKWRTYYGSRWIVYPAVVVQELTSLAW